MGTSVSSAFGHAQGVQGKLTLAENIYRIFGAGQRRAILSETFDSYKPNCITRVCLALHSFKLEFLIFPYMTHFAFLSMIKSCIHILEIWKAYLTLM